MRLETRKAELETSSTEVADVRRESLQGPAPSRFTVDRVVRFVLGIGLVLILGSFLWYFARLVIYLLTGLVLAYLIRPIVDRVQSLGLGRIPAILVGFLFFFGLISMLLTYLVPFVGRQVSELSQQIEAEVQVIEIVPGTATLHGALETGDIVLAVDNQSIRRIEQLKDIIGLKREGEVVTLDIEDISGQRHLVNVTLGEFEVTPEEPAGRLVENTEGEVLNALGLRVRTVIFADVIDSAENRVREYMPVEEGTFINAVSGIFETLFQEDRITRIFRSVLSLFTDIFYAVLVIPFVAFFVLKDGFRIKHSLLQMVPNRYFEITLAINEKIEHNIGRYFRGLLIQSLSIASLATILLSLFGLKSALAVGIFAGVANTIPYFGPLMGFLAGTLVGVAQTGDFSLILGVLIAMGLTQVADNVFFQPLIFSRAAQAHPLIILFVVLIGAQLGGIIGMLVAIPLTTIVRVTVQQVVWSLRNYRILQAN